MSERADFSVAHLTTVDMSLRYLLAPQLRAVVDIGGRAVGISAPGPWVAGLEEMGVVHLPLRHSTRGMSLLADFRAARELWRLLRSERPTVLHTHNPKPGLYGRVLGRLAGVPLVVNTVHGFYATPDDPWQKRAVVYLLEAIASRFSDAELFQNPEDLELAVRTGITARRKAQLLGNGVDLERFAPERAELGGVARIREEIGAAPDTVVVGIVGRLVAEKGYLELFEAMRRLDPRFKLVVIGPEDRDKADAVDAEAVARARDDGVVFLGMRDDVVDLYAAMDLFVLPSHREGFPRAAMEAAAMGLPVVATDIRGCRQVVADGENGFLVPVSEPAALAAALRRLGEDEALRKKMGAASRQKALREFDERDVVSRVMATYWERLGEKGLGYLIPSAAGDPVALQIREARPGDARALANMHIDAISTGFLPRLGRRFMTVLYQALIGWEDAVVLVGAEGDDPVAFVAGVEDTRAFNTHFVRRYGARALFAAFPALLDPRVIKRALETFRQVQSEEEIPGELLSMAVAPRARRRGLALQLGEGMLGSLRAAAVKVVVGSDNLAARKAYEQMGFVEDHRIAVHAGESSEVMVWRR